MRDFNEIERQRLQSGHCPSCGHPKPRWNNGPLGGAARNLEMTCCGARINVIDPDRYGWPPPGIVGQVLEQPTQPASGRYS